MTFINIIFFELIFISNLKVRFHKFTQIHINKVDNCGRFTNHGYTEINKSVERGGTADAEA